MRGLVLAAAVLAAGALIASEAAGHAMPNSTVVLSAEGSGLTVETTIPLAELEAALGGAVAEADLRGVEAYLREHVSVRTAGQTWVMTPRRLALERGDHPALKATLAFAPPAGPHPTGAELRYDAVTHRIASHYALVYWQATDGRKPLGRLQLPTTTVGLPAAYATEGAYPLVWQVDDGAFYVALNLAPPRRPHAVRLYCERGSSRAQVFVRTYHDLGIVDGEVRRRDRPIAVTLLSKSVSVQQSARAELSLHGGESAVAFLLEPMDEAARALSNGEQLDIRVPDGVLATISPPVPAFTWFISACRGGANTTGG